MARRLRRIADRLDPKPARWYASAWQQSATIQYTGTSNTASARPRRVSFHHVPLPKPKHRVLADYLTTMDLKKLRP